MLGPNKPSNTDECKCLALRPQGAFPCLWRSRTCLSWPSPLEGRLCSACHLIQFTPEEITSKNPPDRRLCNLQKRATDDKPPIPRGIERSTVSRRPQSFYCTRLTQQTVSSSLNEHVHVNKQIT